MSIAFVKGHGSGNDFILIDNRKKDFPISNPSFISQLCHRRFGIGADGLILLEKAEEADYRMVYFNADGYEADLCGNGLRCFVVFAGALGDQRETLLVETKSGSIRCKRKGEKVTCAFPEPTLLQGPFSLPLTDETKEAFLVDSGVPHIVLFSEDLEEENLAFLGKEIRNHPLFYPEGVNVNFIQLKEEGIYVRTYERGVEGETLACGTAALAVAKVLSFLEDLKHVVIFPRSRDSIEVNMVNWELTGSATLTYSGHIQVPSEMPFHFCKVLSL